MDYRKKFAIEPGAQVQLAKIDASYTRKLSPRSKPMSNVWRLSRARLARRCRRTLVQQLGFVGLPFPLPD